MPSSTPWTRPVNFTDVTSCGRGIESSSPGPRTRLNCRPNASGMSHETPVFGLGGLSSVSCFAVSGRLSMVGFGSSLSGIPLIARPRRIASMRESACAAR